MTYLVINDYFSTHVLSEDTWSREVKDGCLYTKRILTKTNRVPKWGERYVHIVSFETRFKKKKKTLAFGIYSIIEGLYRNTRNIHKGHPQTPDRQSVKLC